MRIGEYFKLAYFRWPTFKAYTYRHKRNRSYLFIEREILIYAVSYTLLESYRSAYTHNTS